MLDVACGHGRHMKWFAGRGCTSTGVDQSAEALKSAAQWGDVVQADIENGPWPLNGPPGSPGAPDAAPPRTFDLVVVTHYLWRPLLGVIAQSLAPGGVLLYETFAHGNETVGKPSRPDFLLRPGELLQAFAALRIVAFEDGFLPAPDRFVQRLVAIAPGILPDTAPPTAAAAGSGLPTGRGDAPGLPRRYTL